MTDSRELELLRKIETSTTERDRLRAIILDISKKAKAVMSAGGGAQSFFNFIMEVERLSAD